MLLSRTLSVVAALLGLGCGKLVEADRFQVTSARNPCGPGQVPVGDACQSAGVEECALWFERDEDGCRPVQPAAACPDGQFAPPGMRVCSILNTVSCDDARFPRLDVTSTEQVRYVDPSVAPGGDGSELRPLDSIASALTTLTGDGTLVLARGSHRGNWDLSEHAGFLRLVGSCNDTILEAGDPAQPALRLGGGFGRKLENLAIRGGSAGIEGAELGELRLQGVWIHDVAGPGIALDNEDAPADVLLENILIERVVGAGVSVRGSVVTIDSAQIQEVRSARAGARGVGVEVGASAIFQGVDPSLRRPAALRLNRSSILGTVGAGVTVAESSARIENTWIDRIAPDDLGLGRGIEAQGSASLSLPTKVEVESTVIGAAEDAGIAGTSADLIVRDVTLRHIGDRRSQGCRGSGVLATFPFRVGDEPATLDVRGASIRGVGRAGIEVLGASALLERVSLTQEADAACDGTVGLRSDAAAASDPPQLELRSSRVDGFDTGVLAHGSALRSGGNLLACNAEPLLADGAYDGEDVCGCDGDWNYCVPRRFELDTSCTAHGDTTCLRVCLGVITRWVDPVAGASLWLLDHPSVPSVRSDKSGCVDFPGVPRNVPFAVAVSAASFAPGVAMASPIDLPFEAPSRATLIPLETTAFYGAAVRRLAPVGEERPEGTDTRLSPLVDVRVCKKPRPLPLPGEEREDGEGLCEPFPGIVVRVNPPAALPVYFDGNIIPKERLAATQAADVVFADLAPGPYQVLLEPPAGTKMSCVPNRWGWTGAGPNEFSFHVEPGLTGFGAELVCTEEP